LNKIIPDGEQRSRMIERLRSVKAKLKRGSDQGRPSEIAAEIILKMIESHDPGSRN